MFDAVDEALNAIPQPVEALVEWTCTVLIHLSRDSDSDMVLPEELPDFAAAVSLVSCHPFGSKAGSTFALPFDGTGLHQILKGYDLTPLSGGQDESHELSAPIDSEVDFGGKSSL